MKRWAFTVLCVFLACALAAGICCAAPAEDLERKIGELEKAIEESVKSGRGLSPELMEELGKTVDELLKGEKDGDEGNGKESVGRWEEVPFTGTITISQTFAGSAVTKDDEEGGKESGPGKKKWRWSGKKENENEKSRPSERGGSSSWSFSSSASLSAVITGSEPIHDEDGNVTGYQPVGYVTGQVAEREIFQGKGGYLLFKYSDSAREEHAFNPGARDDWCKLNVNPEEGRYNLSFPSIRLSGGKGEEVRVLYDPSYRYTEPWHGIHTSVSLRKGPDREALRYSPGSGVIQGSFQYSMPSGGMDAALLRREWDSTHPELSGLKEMLISEAAAIEKTFASMAGKVPGVHSGTYSASWSLNIGKVPVRVELEPVGDYENWMPELIWGVGNFVRVKAKIVEPAGLRGKIRFTLEDVSREPGFCMNHPFRDQEEAPDLIISEMSGSGLKIAEDGQTAVTFDDVNEREIVLQARDFGARGKLSATATVQAGGKEMEVRAVLKGTGERWVTLPKDENGNGIADCWEKAHDIWHCIADSDDDGEPEGKYPGDGLSAYEEYRGFFVKGKHVRLDPNKKDLFVYDPDGLAEKARFGPVTALEVHYIDPEEGRCTGTKDRARVVNFRSGFSHLVDQHCLWIKKGALKEPDPFNWGLCEGGEEIGPPRTADRYVLVYVDQIREDLERTVEENRNDIADALRERGLRSDAAWFEGQVDAAVAMTTIHEACHGLGITHHYKSLRETLPKGADVEKAIMALDISPSTGQMNCVMRYTRDWGKHPRLTFKAETETLDMLRGRPWPNTLCDTMDDCRGQMIVSDRETGQIF